MVKKELKILVIYGYGDVGTFCSKLELKIQEEKFKSKGQFAIDEALFRVRFATASKFRERLKAFRLAEFSAYVLFGTQNSINNFEPKIQDILGKRVLNKSFIFIDQEEDDPSGLYLEKMDKLMDFLWRLCEPEENETN